MTLRAPLAADARAIAEVHVRTWRHAYREILPARILDALSVEVRAKVWAERIAAGDGSRVAERAGTILGWIAFGACRDADAEAGQGEVYGIYVAPEAWSQGVGTSLMDAGLASLRDLGFETVTLWVFEANARSRRFYESRGFVLDDGAVKLFERDGASVREVRYRRATTPAVG